MNIFLPIPHNGATRNGHNKSTGEGCTKAKEGGGGCVCVCEEGREEEGRVGGGWGEQKGYYEYIGSIRSWTVRENTPRERLVSDDPHTRLTYLHTTTLYLSLPRP